jgi:hypothetical protein
MSEQKVPGCCPDCGAIVRREGYGAGGYLWAIADCGRYWCSYDDGDWGVRTPICYRDEIANLRAENAALRREKWIAERKISLLMYHADAYMLARMDKHATIAEAEYDAHKEEVQE